MRQNANMSTLDQFAPVLIMLALSTGLAFIIHSVSRIFGPRRPTARKLAPYESGMKPIGEGTRRVPIKFYLVAVLFILFDVEVMFFLPWAVVMKELALFGLVAMGVFALVLTIGLFYEWRKGAMEWE